jgi:hypothetical protein
VSPRSSRKLCFSPAPARGLTRRKFECVNICERQCAILTTIANFIFGKAANIAGPAELQLACAPRLARDRQHAVFEYKNAFFLLNLHGFSNFAPQPKMRF